MEIILFIAIIILFFWIASLSNKVVVLEKRLKQGVVSSNAEKSEGYKVDEKPKEIFAPKPPVEYGQAVLSTPMTEAQQTELATNWLNRIGIVAVVLGMVFFFKYAIDQGWITPWMRIIIGFLVSGLLVYLGELWKEKYGKRAQALSGGGIALFYFTIFAAYQFYNIMPQPVAWAIMLAVAALSVCLSFRYSSLVLGVLGFFGAYGSPLMLSSGRDQQVGLIVYLTVMNIVALAICVKKFWAELLFLGLLGTIIDYLFWAHTYSSQQNTFTSIFFVILTSLLMVLGAPALLRYHRGNNAVPEFIDKNLSALYIFAGAFYFFSIWVLLNRDFHNFLAPIALLGSVIFFFAYALADRLEYRAINYCLSFAGGALLVSAALWQFDGKAQGLALLGIALLGTSLGFLAKREELRVWGLIVLFLSLFKSLFEPYAAQDEVFLFNAKFGLMFANTLAMLFVGWMYSKFPVSKFEENASDVVYATASLLLWFAVSWEIVEYLRNSESSNARNLLLSLWWVMYAVILMITGSLTRRSVFRKVSIALFALSILKVFLYDVQALDTPYRVVAFIVLGVILLSVSFSYRKNKEKIVNFLEGDTLK